MAEQTQQVQGEVQIVDFNAEKHGAAFRALNEEWISTYFVMEAADYKALDHPQEYILDKGGHILIAEDGTQPVGTCALVKMREDHNYELAKMSVYPTSHGRGIGNKLMAATIERARSIGAKRIFIESNRKLVPAISLYRKFGFIEIDGGVSPYERCDIQMELLL
jgi:GNAT superfamily N-acetyltransferase